MANTALSTLSKADIFAAPSVYPDDDCPARVETVPDAMVTARIMVPSPTSRLNRSGETSRLTGRLNRALVPLPSACPELPVVLPAKSVAVMKQPAAQKLSSVD